MPRRSPILPFLAAVSWVPAVLGCGSDNSAARPIDGGAPFDATGPQDGQVESAVDGTSEGAVEAATVDSEAGPAATEDSGPSEDAGDGGAPWIALATGDDVFPFGVTTDGFVGYADFGTFDGGSSLIASVVPVTGGVSQLVAPVVTAWVTGPTVLYAGANNQGGFLDGVWSNAYGSMTLSEDVTFNSDPPIGARADGSEVAYIDASGLTLVTFGDGGVARTLLSSTVFPAPTIGDSYVAFAANGDLLVDYFPEEADAAAGASYVLSVFRGAAGPEVVLATNATWWAYDTAGAWLYATLSSGTSELVRVSDGSVISLDSNSTTALFDPTGATLFYVTQAGALKSVATADGSVTTLVTSDAVNPLALSPNGAVLLYTGATTPIDGGEEINYFTVATALPATPTPLFTDRVMQSPVFQGDFFTVDSSYVIVDSNFMLEAAPVGGGTTIEVAAYEGGDHTALSGHIMLYQSSTRLERIDVTSPAPPLDFLPGGCTEYVFTPDRSTIVYGTELGTKFGQLIAVPF